MSMDSGKIAELMTFERSLRMASDYKHLQMVIVNEFRRVVPYTMAVFFSPAGKKFRAAAVSDISVLDRTTPFIITIEKIINKLKFTPEGQNVINTDIETLAGNEAIGDIRSMLPPYIRFVKLTGKQGRTIGLVLMARQQQWTTEEQPLLVHLSEIASFAMSAKAGAGSLISANFFNLIHTRSFWVAALVLLPFLFLIPVNLSVVAPSEIVPVNPFRVTSPLDGIVKAINIKPNQPVQKGEMLVELHDTELRSRYLVAAEALKVTEEEYQNAQRTAFKDLQARAKLLELKTRVDVRRAELHMAKTMLEKASISAERGGVAVIADPHGWKGRPVRAGEEIMAIAEPDDIEIEIWVPTKDAVVTRYGTEVKVFLDEYPMKSIKGKVREIDYKAKTSPSGIFAYRLRADITVADIKPRIGLHGTAKLYGEKTTLFYYVFRRPITAMRQWTGW